MPPGPKRIQTDWGQEFIDLDFQDSLRQHHIKFRPNRPRAPHLNGKAERSQRTDRMEFWATVVLTAPVEKLEQQLLQGQHFYNHERTHTALGWKTPAHRLQGVRTVIPSREEVQAAYGSLKGSYVTISRYVWAKIQHAYGENSLGNPHSHG